MVQRIDSHQHFWQPARGDYAWLRADDAALAPLRRDFLPEHLLGLLQAHGVEQTVLVQAAQSDDETAYLLTLARAHGFVGGVVGWSDLSRPGAAAALAQLAADPLFKGVRPMLQDLPAHDWIAHAPRSDAVQALLRHGLRLDALVKPRHLEPLLRFVRRHPELPVVIDHAAKPLLARGWDADWVQPWQQHMAELAACPNVMCKFSGLLTEAPPLPRGDVASAVQVLRPVWQRLLDGFGPRRLMWGSDWPVLTLAADYAHWLAVCDVLFSELSAGEQDQLWQGSARRFYGLEPLAAGPAR
ncbi:amidohydrolase family protein [Aquabacterium sp.]|uniref:amidohydrolase family protein n=1 Tax=Aquabacterium sp. TaxID=1872578 RepID=UPI002D1C1A8D|nr:amidohydrolase family protein [Aquabacterium sp.]HSW05995.1 amidohydrolase family protein [Aquabacterium sp.]